MSTVTPKLTIDQFRLAFADFAKSLRTFLNMKDLQHNAINSKLEPLHIKQAAELFQTIEWSDETAKELAPTVESWLAQWDDLHFFSFYKAMSKPRQNIKLLAAINNSCGLRISRMYNVNKEKNGAYVELPYIDPEPVQTTS